MVNLIIGGGIFELPSTVTRGPVEGSGALVVCAAGAVCDGPGLTATGKLLGRHKVQAGGT